MSTQKINFVSINLPGEDQFLIDADGVTLRYMDYLDVWGMDLERAEKVFDAALRSVQVIREFSGSAAAPSVVCGGRTAGSAATEVASSAAMDEVTPGVGFNTDAVSPSDSQVPQAPAVRTNWQYCYDCDGWFTTEDPCA